MWTETEKGVPLYCTCKHKKLKKMFDLSVTTTTLANAMFNLLVPELLFFLISAYPVYKM